jgi:UDP-glucuronate decarboxylase
MGSADSVTGPINLGNPVEMTVAELATLIVELVGSRSKIEYRPLPIDDPTQRCPNITVARETLGWEPKVALNAGLQRTIAYFDQLLRDTEQRDGALVRLQA